MHRIDGPAPWLHGSPEILDVLRTGSTITQDRTLARAFSHKPSLVSFDEHGVIFHNGRRAGILYQIVEEIGPADVTPVPGTTLPPGAEWLITRPMRVAPIERVEIDPEELLTEDEEEELRRRMEVMDR